MKSESTVTRTLELPGGAIVPFSSVPGERLRILHGRVWLTEEGDPRDAFLASGAEVDLATRGLAVIEALGPARVQLIEPVSAVRTVANAARRAAAGLLRRGTDNDWEKAMTRGLETTAFLAATVSALALTAFIGLQEFAGGTTVSDAVKALAKLDGRTGLIQRVEVQPRRAGG